MLQETKFRVIDHCQKKKKKKVRSTLVERTSVASEGLAQACAHGTIFVHTKQRVPFTMMVMHTTSF